MSNYKAIIQYDGTNYKGWQIQNSTKDTIQGKLQKALTDVTKTDIEVIGSGRTDGGVHAKGQVANFHINTKLPFSDNELLLQINKKLPEDIALVSLNKVDERFHARYSEKGKTYRYRIHVSPVADVFEKRFVYTYLDKKIDIQLMKKAATFFTGKHDFKAFCGNKHMKKSTIRTITSIDINEIYDENGLKEITIDYTGNGFLQQMIRILTGTLIEVATGRINLNTLPQILESGVRDNAGYTAPPQGLCLMEVYY